MIPTSEQLKGVLIFELKRLIQMIDDKDYDGSSDYYHNVKEEIIMRKQAVCINLKHTFGYLMDLHDKQEVIDLIDEVKY